jgi:hypothetical protein
MAGDGSAWDRRKTETWLTLSQINVHKILLCTVSYLALALENVRFFLFSHDVLDSNLTS